MKTANNVFRLKLPNTAKQADWLTRTARREKLVEVEIKLLPDDDSFLEQRAWRVLFGLYQDCACVQWSKGFTKSTLVPFTGKMSPSKLMLFVREALPMVAEGRAEVRVNGQRLRRRLLDVLAA